MFKTYTMLVTMSFHDGADLSTDLLEVMVKRGLEEGVREMAGVAAAEASVIEGDHLNVRNDRNAFHPQLSQAKRLHDALRA